MALTKFPWGRLGIGFAALGLAAFSARQIYSYFSRKTDQEFHASLLADLAAAMSQETGAAQDDLVEALSRLLDGGNPTELEDVQKLQYSIERTKERYVLKRTAYALVGMADPLSLCSASRLCPWSDLPESIRQKFAASSETNIQYSLFERLKG